MPDSTINGLTALAAGSITGSADLAPIWQASASTTKKVTINDLVSSGAAGITGTTVTGSSSASFLNINGTWNTTGTPTADLLNVTDTASNAASLLMDRQVGGVSKFSVKKDGAISAIAISTSGNATGVGGVNVSAGGTRTVILQGGASSATGVFIGSNGGVQWCSGTDAAGTADTIIWRDAAGVLAQRNGTNAQEFRVYGTTTGSKYASVKHDGTNAYFVPTAGQTAFASAALATNATTGFLTIPTCAGTPTGVPANIPTGQVPIVYDTTNNKIAVYNGAWKQTAALT